MRIAPINTTNFQKLYRKDDVLKIITGYENGHGNRIPEIMQDMTGIDCFSKEAMEIMEEEEYPGAIYYNMLEQCKKKIINQYPDLKEVDEDFYAHVTNCPGNRTALNVWFQAQLDIMKKVYDIEPFKLNIRKLKENIKETVEIFKKFDV